MHGLRFVHDVYDEQAAHSPEATAVVCRASSRRSFTYAEVCARSAELAQGFARWKRLQGLGNETETLIAVYLRRTHADFLPLLLAASRAGLPFVLLSADLPDRVLETQRNVMALQVLETRLCIFDESFSEETTRFIHDAGVEAIAVAELARTARQETLVVRCPAATSSGIFCFMFTGGTFRTKVVQATHAMVLHERVTYPQLWRPRGAPPIVLGNTSVYWAASALGQMDIALAYGGAIVWTEVTEVAELRNCIAEERVNVLGIVPDLLDLLAPQAPLRELPTVELVFTWGERLPLRTAERWRNHPQAILRELLISTEYWLALWADPLGNGVMNVLPGTEILLLKDDGSDAGMEDVGELCISGPMVMEGYRKLSNGAGMPQDVFHIASTGRRFFKTRDLVRRVPGGLLYKGRADMMTKDKGKWVDMLAVEDSISALPGVRAAKILADPVHEHFHCFAVLDEAMPAAKILDVIRTSVPARSQVWQVPELPRHPVTRKVDSARLLKVVKSQPSWPLQRCAEGEHVPAELRARLAQKVYSQFAWTCAVAAMALAAADESRLLVQLAMAFAIWTGAPVIITCGENASTLIVVAVWLALVILVQRPGLLQILSGLKTLALWTYAWHTLIYADDRRNTSRIARATMAFVDKMPLWKIGALLFLSIGQHLPSPCGQVMYSVLAALAGFGAVMAWWRGRLLAWPVVFWSFGGHQIDKDCSNWTHMSLSDWRRYIVDVSCGPVCGIATAVWSTIRPAAPPASADATAVQATFGPATTKPDEFCESCGSIVSMQWPARDDGNKILCQACGVRFVEEKESKAVAWLTECIRAGSSKEKSGERATWACEPAPKRPRTERGSSEHSSVDACKAQANMESKDDRQNDRWWWEKQGRELTTSWWYNHLTDIFDITAEGAEWQAREAREAAPQLREEAPSGLARKLCTLIGEIDPFLKPVHMGSVLLGFDSLRVARLSNAIRNQLGRELAAAQLRAAPTVKELLAAVAGAEEVCNVPMPQGEDSRATDDTGREYAVWFSPGQWRGMGGWILRAESRIDRAAMVRATQQLADRHMALRAEAADPLRYLSFMYDCANLFILYAPFLDAGSVLLRALRRLLSWACMKTWPRVKIKTRSQLYSRCKPETAVPLDIWELHDGQIELERAIKRLKNDLKPPFSLGVCELVCYLVDAWAYQRYDGKFVVVRASDASKADAGSAEPDLFYVDQSSGEWGPLIDPGSSRWETPPYGFPALFFVPMNNGAVAWLRLNKRDELRVCYRPGGLHSGTMYHLAAFRQNPQRPRTAHEPIVVSYLSVCMWHAWGDGNCYLPFVQDLLALYKAAASGQTKLSLPPLACAFEELQRRLFDTFQAKLAPSTCSLRGSIWRYEGRGYGHNLGLNPATIRILTRVLANYRMPLDVGLLGLVVCALARADQTERIDLTLYTPQRDGAAQTMLLGLFSDWRDVSLSADFQLATTIGTLLQLSHKIQHRLWTSFNALQKPEAIVVNIQPLDFEKHADFMHLGENMWRDGDQIGVAEHRSNEIPWVHQQANFTIEQQDSETWWILMSAGYDQRPTSWARRFIFCFEDAMKSLLLDPLALVHRAAPDDRTLLQNYKAQHLNARRTVENLA